MKINLSRAFSILLMSAFLAACGGGGGGDSTPPPVVTPPPADTQAPTVSISSPADGATLSAATTISGTASDNVGVTAVAVSVIDSNGNTTSLPTTGTTSFSADWDVTQFAEGAYTIRVEASDAAGNVGPEDISVTVESPPPADTQAPTVSISSPADGATLSAATTISGTASDNVGVTAVAVSVIDSNGNTTSLPTTGTTSFSADWDVTQFAEGAYTIRVEASDAAGNVGPEDISVTVESPPPTGTVADYIGFDPRVVRNAPTSTELVTFEYCFFSDEVTEVFADWRIAGLTGSSNNRANLPLIDSGTPCGSTPGATLWTNTVVPELEMPADTPLGGDLADYLNISFGLFDGDGVRIVPDNFINQSQDFIVMDETRQDCNRQELAPNVFWCPGVVNVVLSNSEFLQPLNEVVQAVTSTYFAEAADVDFLVIQFENRQYGRGGNFQIFVQNNVEGLCRPIFDSSATFNSAGALQGISFVNSLFGLPLNHEIGHRWLNYCNNPPGTQSANEIHYDYVNFPDPMSDGLGFLEDTNTGDFQVSIPPGGFLNEDFSQLSRYLAGDSQATVPNWRALNPALRTLYSIFDIVPLSDTIEYSLLDDYIGVNGMVRNVDGSPRQQTFTIGRALVSVDRPADIRAMTLISELQAFTVSNNIGVSEINNNGFRRQDIRSLNAAFGGNLVFTDGVRPLSQSAVQMKTGMQLWNTPGPEAGVSIEIIHEPIEGYEDDHFFEVIELQPMDTAKR